MSPDETPLDDLIADPTDAEPDDVAFADGTDDGATGPAARAAPMRTCVLTRATADRAAMLRLVIGPDGDVWADLGARLPGRGAWIAPDQAALRAAVTRGKLRGVLARAFRVAPPIVPADLPDRIESGLRQRLLNRLGLEHRAGALIFGSERLAESARAGRLALLLHAADAADDGTGKLEQAMRVGEGRPGIRLAIPRDALSAALGRDNSVHLGVTSDKAAARIAGDVARLHAWLGMDTGSNLDQGDAAQGVAVESDMGAATPPVMAEGER